MTEFSTGNDEILTCKKNDIIYITNCNIFNNEDKLGSGRGLVMCYNEKRQVYIY